MPKIVMIKNNFTPFVFYDNKSRKYCFYHPSSPTSFGSHSTLNEYSNEFNVTWGFI